MSKKIVTLDNLEYFYKKLEVAVPTKTSDLTNDSGFITINDVPVLEIPDEYITDEELSQKGYATKEELSDKQDTITDLEVIRQGAAKGATALQSYTEQYKGTVTGVKVNGSTKNPSSGVVDLGTVITSHQDISGKQDKLVSGTNIKTINGTSILGSGDIEVNGADLSGYATEEWVNNNYATEYDLNNIVGVLNQSIASKQDKIDNLVIAEDVNEELDDVETNTYLKYVAQTLTDEQKAQARANIGAEDTLKFMINGRNITPENGIVNLNVVETSLLSTDYGDGYVAVIPGLMMNEQDGALYSLPNMIDDSISELQLPIDELVAKSYVDGLVGDINSVLESIIGYALTFPITLTIGDNGVVGINLFNYLYNKYSAKDTISEDIYIGTTRMVTIDYKAEDYVVLIGGPQLGYILYSSGVIAYASGSGADQ